MLFPLIYEEQIHLFTLWSSHKNLGRQIENWTQSESFCCQVSSSMFLCYFLFRCGGHAFLVSRVRFLSFVLISFSCSLLPSWFLFHWLSSACLWAYLWPWPGLCHSYLLAMDKARICESLKHLKHLCRHCIEALKQSEIRHHICWLIGHRYILMTLFCETMTPARPNKATHDPRLSMSVISTCYGAFSTQTRLHWSVCFSQSLHLWTFALLTINQFLKQNLQRTDGCVYCCNHTGYSCFGLIVLKLGVSGWLHTAKQS